MRNNEKFSINNLRDLHYYFWHIFMINSYPYYVISQVVCNLFHFLPNYDFYSNWTIFEPLLQHENFFALSSVKSLLTWKKIQTRFFLTLHKIFHVNHTFLSFILQWQVDMFPNNHQRRQEVLSLQCLGTNYTQ